MSSRSPGGVRRTRRQGRPEAFTLVELLVVIAILSLLLSILAPTLGRTRYLAKRVICLSNMRQQSTSLMTYGSSNRGNFPLRNEHSPDYHRQSGNASSCVSTMRGRYINNTAIIICPLAAEVRTQPLGEYRGNDWYVASGYGGWNTSAAHVYTSYMWLGGFNGGGYAVAMIDSEPPPPPSTRECEGGVPFITHRLNFYNSLNLHEIAHGGRGLFVNPAVPYEDTIVTEMPVLYGDSSALLHTGGEIKPRMTVGGNYPSNCGFPGTYLW